MFPRFVNMTDTQLYAGFRKGTSFTMKLFDFSSKSQIRLIKKRHSREYPANVDASLNLRYTHRGVTNEVSDTQLLEVQGALTNVFRSTAFKWITFYFHCLYRECPIMVIVLAKPTQRWAALLL